MSDFADAADAPAVVQSLAMQTFIVEHIVRALPLSLAIVLVSGVSLLAIQGTPNGHHSPDGFSDATIVIRWSQLAHDNALAVDPGTTDPFPSARGWTMMYSCAGSPDRAISLIATNLLRRRSSRRLIYRTGTR